MPDSPNLGRSTTLLAAIYYRSNALGLQRCQLLRLGGFPFGIPFLITPMLPFAPANGPRTDQRWATFLKNHARGIIACDFCIAVTATFRVIYVLVIMEHASRRLIHLNATLHPTAAWTLQQLREAIPSDHKYRFTIHDHNSIFSTELDASLTRLGLKVITTPRRSPQANSFCEG